MGTTVDLVCPWLTGGVAVGVAGVAGVDSAGASASGAAGIAGAASLKETMMHGVHQ